MGERQPKIAVGTDKLIKEYGMDIDLYVSAMQVVPLLLIALFLDNRNVEERPTTPRGRWYRMPDKIYALLGITAFSTSMFVVAGVVEASRFTMTIVVTALSGAISLLSAQIWRRFDRGASPSPKPPDRTPVVDPTRPTEGEDHAERDADRRGPSPRPLEGRRHASTSGGSSAAALTSPSPTARADWPDEPPADASGR